LPRTNPGFWSPHISMDVCQPRVRSISASSMSMEQVGNPTT